MHSKIWSKPVILLISLLLILGVTISGTIAFIVATDDPAKSEFAPGEVRCYLEESTGNYTIINLGSTEVYVRVAVVANWLKNGHIYGLTPITPNDYQVLFNAADWTYWNGYYYYNYPLAPNGWTTPLTPLQLTAAPEGCRFSAEILSESIQSQPAQAAAQVWGYIPLGN